MGKLSDDCCGWCDMVQLSWMLNSLSSVRESWVMSDLPQRLSLSFPMFQGKLSDDYCGGCGFPKVYPRKAEGQLLCGMWRCPAFWMLKRLSSMQESWVTPHLPRQSSLSLPWNIGKPSDGCFGGCDITQLFWTLDSLCKESWVITAVGNVASKIGEWRHSSGHLAFLCSLEYHAWLHAFRKQMWMIKTWGWLRADLKQKGCSSRHRTTI